jgi:hypothetical protein
MGIATTFEFGQAWVEAVARMGYDMTPRVAALTSRAVRGPLYVEYRHHWDEQRHQTGVSARRFLSNHWFELRAVLAQPRSDGLARTA